MSRLNNYLEEVITRTCFNCQHWQKQKKIQGQYLGQCNGLDSIIETSEGEGATVFTPADFFCANFRLKGKGKKK